jgi:hypothetical protein
MDLKSDYGKNENQISKRYMGLKEKFLEMKEIDILGSHPSVVRFKGHTQKTGLKVV